MLTVVNDIDKICQNTSRAPLSQPEWRESGFAYLLRLSLLNSRPVAKEEATEPVILLLGWDVGTFLPETQSEIAGSAGSTDDGSPWLPAYFAYLHQECVDGTRFRCETFVTVCCFRSVGLTDYSTSRTNRA